MPGRLTGSLRPWQWCKAPGRLTACRVAASPHAVWHSGPVSESPLVELAEAVRAAAENRARQRQLAVQLETTESLVATRRDELAQLQQALQVELSDVSRLEEVSLTKLWATLRGNVADRLAIERAEADVAGIAVASAQSRLDRAVAEDARVRREHDALRGADRAYADALAAFETAVLAVGGRDAEELTALAEQLGVTQARHREVAEAVDALNTARTALDAALAKLDSAGRWSTYDTFFGGGLVSDIGQALEHRMTRPKRSGRSTEPWSGSPSSVADIGGATIDGVDVSQTLAVFDVLFDNIVSDWMVRERISDAKARAEDLRRRLSQLASELDAEAAASSTRVTGLLRRREEILTTT